MLNPRARPAEPPSMVARDFRILLRDETGQGLIEYAFIIALVAMIALAGLKLMGGAASSSLNTSANQIFI